MGVEAKFFLVLKRLETEKETLRVIHMASDRQAAEDWLKAHVADTFLKDGRLAAVAYLIVDVQHTLDVPAFALQATIMRRQDQTNGNGKEPDLSRRSSVGAETDHWTDHPVMPKGGNNGQSNEMPPVMLPRVGNRGMVEGSPLPDLR